MTGGYSGEGTKGLQEMDVLREEIIDMEKVRMKPGDENGERKRTIMKTTSGAIVRFAPFTTQCGNVMGPLIA